ncbi:MAG: glycoside hydrolase family 3 C-terminal domain-containing protein [Flavobacteriaceae bacterium]|nr:glycoside hydrolase family 3 C-terminal domain-containing protein [Flavobacteriaceae bacterium]
MPKKKFFFELLPPINEMVLDVIALAANKMNWLLFLGRLRGDFRDRKKEGIIPAPAEKDMIKLVAENFHRQNKKVVVILNIGNVIETASWSNQVDGIILAWQGGQEGGNAVADVITGKVNPSGKLPTTFPIDYHDIPSSKNFPVETFRGRRKLEWVGLSGTPSEVIYEEDIYIGYRFFDTFKVKDSLSFRLWASSTSFQIDQLSADTKQLNDKLLVRVRVTDTGKSSGKEVVQLYLTAPKGSINKPAQELKGFARAHLSEPKPGKVMLEMTVPVKT